MAEIEKNKKSLPQQNFESVIRKNKRERSLSPDMFTNSNSSVDDVNLEQDSFKKVTWRGSPLCTFTRFLSTNFNVPPIVLAPDHQVYVKLPLNNGKAPMPYPEKYSDVWSSEYVRMPNSPESLYPVKTHGVKKVVQRWLVIQEAYQKKITSFEGLREAILHYNHRYEEKWKFEGLKLLLEQDFAEEEKDFFIQTLLPRIIQLALELPKIVTKPIVLLTRKCTRSISLSQKQISCLLANAFLCTFPRRNAKGSQTEYASYPDINFNRLFCHRAKPALEKMKCIIHYFKEATSRELTGMVTFSRQFISYLNMPEFETCSSPLSRLHVDSEGLIEEANGLLQMDFANKFIGGGVLGLGCVQEEIRFVICPELLLTRLFTEVLEKNEVLIVTGVEQFSKGRGYSSSFEWVGSHVDQTLRDPWHRRLCQVVAVDALHFSKNPSRQYQSKLILRELQKAYVGFNPLDGSMGNTVGLATGNWGCGAFRGDPKLKCLIQLAAASVAGRDMAYFTFGDVALRDELADMHLFLRENSVTVGQLVMALCQYGMKGDIDGSSLFKYIYKTFSHYYSDTDSGEGTSSTPNIIHEENKEEKTVRKNITDYFKPVSTHEKSSQRTKLTSSHSTNKSKSSQQPSITEEKIMEALNECDRLVKGKKMDEERSSSKRLPEETSLNIDKKDSEKAWRDVTVISSSSNLSANANLKSSPHPQTGTRTNPSLLDWLNKVDQTHS